MQETPIRDRKSVTHEHILATTVKGTDVYNADGEHLGHVDDIVLDKVSGQAEYAIMSFGGFLGIGEKFHPLPWRSLTYDPALAGYVVNVTREQLEAAPSYGLMEEPDWSDPAYAQRLRGYYGYPVL
jgi:sporulation protein YlmC with PRC-barrel domain